MSGRAVHLATGMTPAAKVLTNAQPDTPEWYLARRKGITATDIPKIVGASKYGNAVTVWMDKRRADDDLEQTVGDDEAAEWGHILEPVIAKVWATKHHTRVVTPETLCNKREPWQIANLDRVSLSCPAGPLPKPWGCPLEIKTRSSWTSSLWESDMPDDVLAQAAWQRIVTGYPHVHIACLIGGQRLVEYTYERDDQLETYLIEQARTVWEQVPHDDPPIAEEPDALLTQVLNDLYPNRDGVAELDGDVVVPLLENYERQRIAAKTAERSRGRLKAAAVQLLGSAELATVDGRPAYSYRANKAGARTLRLAPEFKITDPTEPEE